MFSQYVLNVNVGEISEYVDVMSMSYWYRHARAPSWRHDISFMGSGYVIVITDELSFQSPYIVPL